MIFFPKEVIFAAQKSDRKSQESGLSSQKSDFFRTKSKSRNGFRVCLERVRYENQGVVVLAKLIVARLAGQISNKKRRLVHKSLICSRSKLQTYSQACEHRTKELIKEHRRLSTYPSLTSFAIPPGWPILRELSLTSFALTRVELLKRES